MLKAIEVDDDFKCNNGLAAVYLANLSALPHEKEVLFPAGTTFQVREIQKINSEDT